MVHVHRIAFVVAVTVVAVAAKVSVYAYDWIKEKRGDNQSPSRRRSSSNSGWQR